MPSELHEAQNIHAAKWLKRQGFGVVATNICAAGSREIVDVIGFRNTCSIVIESKVSRSDFFADRKKPERANGAAGLGLYRAYICPVGMIEPDEVPQGWMLLYSNGKKVIDEYKPLGNTWPRFDSTCSGDWSSYQHHVNDEAERAVMYSLCRRLVSGQSILR